MAGALWVLLVALTVYTTTLLMHRFIQGRWLAARLPVTWFYASWIVGLILLALPLYRYQEVFSQRSGAYLIAVLTAFSIGSVGAAFWHQYRHSQARRAHPATAPDIDAGGGIDISARFLLWLLLLGVVGSGLLLVNAVLGGSLSLTERLDSANLAAIRLEHMTGGDNKIGPLYGPANLMSSIGGLGVVLAFYLRGARAANMTSGAWTYWLAYLLLLFNVAVGFIGFGSRMFAVFAAMIAFLACAEGRWAIGDRLIAKRLTAKRLLIIALSSLLAIGALWAAATVFLEQRVQRQDPNTLLFRTHRASLDPIAYQLTRTDVASQYFMFSLSYVTTPIPTLNYYLDLPQSRQPGPFFGEYNFPALFRWGRRLSFTGDPIAWERARYEIFKPLGDIGFGTNVWSTMVRDLLADFTKPGALVFLFVFGWFSQRVFDLQRTYPSARRAGLLVYIRLILMFAGLISILFMPQIYWPLYLAMFLAFRAGRRGSQGQTPKVSPSSRRVAQPAA